MLLSVAFLHVASSTKEFFDSDPFVHEPAVCAPSTETDCSSFDLGNRITCVWVSKVVSFAAKVTFDGHGAVIYDTLPVELKTTRKEGNSWIAGFSSRSKLNEVTSETICHPSACLPEPFRTRLFELTAIVRD